MLRTCLVNWQTSGLKQKSKLEMRMKVKEGLISVKRVLKIWPKACRRCGGDYSLEADLIWGLFKVCAQCSYDEPCDINGNERVLVDED